MRSWLRRWRSGNLVSCCRCDGWAPEQPLFGFWHDAYCWGWRTAWHNVWCAFGPDYTELSCD